MMQTSEKKPLTAAQQHQQAKKRRALLRAALQVFFFFSMPGAFVAGFNGVKLLFQRIGAGEVLQADSFTLSLLGLCGFTLLFGRFFCGYVCAFGGLGDAVYALSSLIQKKLFHRRAPFRPLLRHGRLPGLLQVLRSSCFYHTQHKTREGLHKRLSRVLLMKKTDQKKGQRKCHIT